MKRGNAWRLGVRQGNAWRLGVRQGSAWRLGVTMLLSVSLAALVFTRITVRSDLSGLIPVTRDPQVRLMSEELRTGVAASLLLAGIEGADDAVLARLSDALATRLAADTRFLFAQNGRRLLDPEVAASLFARRYLLAPQQGAAAFKVPALRADFIRLRDALGSSAYPLVQQFGLPDPTGALPALLAAWQGDHRVRTLDGVWFAAGKAPETAPEQGNGAEQRRALLLIRLRAGGTDLGGQAKAIAAIRATFANLAAGLPAKPRLLLGGAPVLSLAAADAVRDDVRLLSSVSALLVMLWLIWRFRSPWMLAAIAITVPLSLSAAALAVQAAFGYVHGITLGFGMTMLGITVDYPVLLVGHRKHAEPAARTIRRIASAFTLSVVTASLGLSGMIGSSFPGVAQLGLFSVTGILTAAALTRWLLPGLIERAGIAPSTAGNPVRLLRSERLRRWRLFGLLPPAAAAAIIVAAGGVPLDHDLAGLTPVPPALLKRDAELRGEIGAPDVGQLAIVRADTPEAVLQAEEAARPVLDRLVADHVMSGADFAARLLPSIETQRSRQAALPAALVLHELVRQAVQGLGFTSRAFDPFEQAVAIARTQPPLTIFGIAAAPLRTRLDALLFERNGSWYGPVIPTSIAEPARLRAAFAARPEWSFIDIQQTTRAIVAGYTRQAWPFLAGGCAAAILVLLLAQRDPLRTGRILAAIAATILVSVAVVVARGGSLSLIHLVALQFVAGIGLDYALFFARTQLDAEERARTLRTLVTCNIMALLTFSLLILCHTPLLRQIGQTVSLGVVLAFCFAFLFAGPLNRSAPR